jgi:hypothetical protein
MTQSPAPADTHSSSGFYIGKNWLPEGWIPPKTIPIPSPRPVLSPASQKTKSLISQVFQFLPKSILLLSQYAKKPKKKSGRPSFLKN